MQINNIVFISIVATLLFCGSKFLEMKYVEKEIKPLKFIIRDAIIVFVSVLSSTFLFLHFNLTLNDFMNVITESKTNVQAITNPAEIFTDKPNF